MGIKIISTGSHTSDEILDNFMLSEMVDTNNEWIVERTGINTRRISRNETTEEIAFNAAKKALEQSGIDKNEIGIIVFASISSDSLVPSSAHTIAGRLGIEECFCFDLNAACSGFIYSIAVVESLMKTMNIRYGLVIGAERLSKYVDWEDRSTCILFGDGAGCALLENKEISLEKSELISEYCEKNYATTSVDSECCTDSIKQKIESKCFGLEILDSFVSGRYDEKKYLSVKSRDSYDLEKDTFSDYIKMNGRQIYKFATDVGIRVIDNLIINSNISKDDIVGIIPHQANRRIVETLSEKSEIEIDKWFMNLDKYGNTSAASVPIALDEFVREFDFESNKGKYIISLAFGGGLTFGGTLFKIC